MGIVCGAGADEHRYRAAEGQQQEQDTLLVAERVEPERQATLEQDDRDGQRDQIRACGAEGLRS